MSDPEYDNDESPIEMSPSQRDTTLGPDGERGYTFDDDDMDLDVADDNQNANDETSSELVVLDPDHPLMTRFQAALKTMLVRQLERAEIENRETSESLRKKQMTHLELGNELYNLQQELAKRQMNLESIQEQLNRAQEGRQYMEGSLDHRRDDYRKLLNQYNVEMQRMTELREKLEVISLRVFYVENAKDELRSDIAVMRRAAEKGDVDMSKLEEQKMKQDLLVDRLTERVDRLREEIALFDAQIIAQSEEKEACKENLRDAQTEIEAIHIERKQLASEWNSSLIGLQRRNEAYAVMLKTLGEQREMIISMNAEVNGYQKSISQEQEQNEKLTMMMRRTESDIATVRKMLAQTQVKHEALKQEYSTYSRMLHETEAALAKASGDKAARQQEVEVLRKQIEKEYLARVKLEDQISEEFRTRLTLQKAAEYTTKLKEKLRDHTREMETQYAIIENGLSAAALKIAETKAETVMRKKFLDELEKEIADKNEIINKLETEMNRNVIVIERKQGQVDLLNKKLEQLIENAGGVELGPLEIEINKLQKTIQVKLEDIGNLEQMWLRDQQELVRVTNEREELTQSVNRFHKQLTILNQKKLRVEGEITGQLRETREIERALRHLENDMVKLNALIYRETDGEESLSKKTSLKEIDFVRELRELEMASMEMKMRIQEVRDEKERLLNELVETERHIMLWEKKIQLAQETQTAVDSDIGQGEIKAMKSEIHRMEVRYSQLMRQQELLIQDMEKSVSRRDTIMTRGEAENKLKHKAVTRGSIQRDIGEVKKKIRDVIQEANSADKELQISGNTLKVLREDISEKEGTLRQLADVVDQLKAQLAEVVDVKRLSVLQLRRRQEMARHYNNVKDGKYNRYCRGQTNREMERLYNRLQSLGLVIDQLMDENPQLLSPLQSFRSAVDNYLADFESGE